MSNSLLTLLSAFNRPRLLLPRPLRYLLLLAVIALALRLFEPSGSRQYLITLMCINALAALGLNVILGMTRLLSIAQAALMAVGGYTCALMLVDWHMSFLIAALAGILASGVVSSFAGLVAGRIRSHYYILVTLGIAGTISLILVNQIDLTGGDNGLGGIPPLTVGALTLSSSPQILGLSLAVLIVGWYLAEALRQSRAGRAMFAVGANEYLAFAAGMSPLRTRVLASAVGGLYAGLAGVLLAEALLFLGPADFDLGQALLLLLIVVIGGMGSNVGTVVGAVLVTYLSQGFLTLTSTGSLVYGLGIMLILLVAPGGLAGISQRLYRRVYYLAKPSGEAR